MKKKVLSFILSICLILPCVFMLSACDNTPPALTKADYIEAFESVTTTYNNYLSGAQATSTSEVITDDDFIDVNNNAQAKNMAKASLAMVYFMRNICEKDEFTLKDGADDCLVDDGTYIYDIRFTLSYNASTSTITTEICADYRENSTLQYFVFDIVYNFDTDTLGEFSILGFSGSDENKVTSNVRYYKFANNTLKVLSNAAEGFDTFAQGVINDMETLLTQEREASPENYSLEYLSAMVEAMG